VEGGKPVLVITSFEDYKKKIGLSSQGGNPTEKGRELLPNSPYSTPGREERKEEVSGEDLTIDDLPLK